MVLKYINHLEFNESVTAVRLIIIQQTDREYLLRKTSNIEIVRARLWRLLKS